MKPGLIIAISLFTVSLSCQTANQSLKRCADIVDPVERYACYDKLAGHSPADTSKAGGTAPGEVAPAAPGADVVVSEAPAARSTVPAVEPKPNAEAVFGLEHKLIPKKERLDKLKLKWTRKEKDAYGKWIIAMENGQVWRQTDGKDFFFINSEHRVILSRGLFGSFFLGEPDSHVLIRVKRVK